MSKKHLRDVAIIIVIVFAITVIVYPLIFSPDKAPADAPPVELELNK